MSVSGKIRGALVKGAMNPSIADPRESGQNSSHGEDAA